MKLVDLWNTHQKPTLSFELFPARNEKAAVRLEKAIDALADLEPDRRRPAHHRHHQCLANHVDELGQHEVAVLGIRQNFP